MWRVRYPVAAVATKETATARAAVAKETCARRDTPPAIKAEAVAAAAAPARTAVLLGAATTTRSAITWGGTASGAVSSDGSDDGGGGGGVRRSSRAVKDGFWYRPFKSLAGGEAGLKRQVEGGISSRPPGTRSRDKLGPDLNLSRPWSPNEAEMFTRALLEEGSKNFYAVQVLLGKGGSVRGLRSLEEFLASCCVCRVMCVCIYRVFCSPPPPPPPTSSQPHTLHLCIFFFPLSRVCPPFLPAPLHLSTNPSLPRHIHSRCLPRCRGGAQKALPDRQVCELVDHYYGGWKQTEAYKTLKESISLTKKQAVGWRAENTTA